MALRRCGRSLQQLRIGPPNMAGQGGRCRLPSGTAGALRSLRQLTALQLRWVGGRVAHWLVHAWEVALQKRSPFASAQPPSC